MMEEKQTLLSPDLAPRLAAIDIGTNSIRLVVAEALRSGSYRTLDDEKETTRLGKSLASTARLDPEAAERTLQALRRMKQIATGYQVRELRVIATCAVREAEDGPDFCRRAKEELGIDIEVISSEQEAHFAFSSVARNFDLAGKNVVVADIGGGSTEIVLASGGVIEDIIGTRLGAVRVSEMFGQGQALDNDQFAELIRHIDRELKRRAKGVMLVPHLLIGSGGTFTTLAEMTLAAKRQVGAAPRGHEITRAEVSHTLDRLRKMPPKTRRNVPGLSPDRVDIITAGVAIIDRLMGYFEVNRLLIHDRGVRDGLLLSMIDNLVGAAAEQSNDRDAIVERLARNCGVDLEHGRQVARLAGVIFDQLAAPFDLCPTDRPLLEAAAKLQDVGYLINYEKHHKHSYHLIANSRLAGFQPRELEMVANIARYHRGSTPKRRHENFKRLSRDEQRQARRLSAILRLAGGLDRSNSRQVRSVEVTVERDRVVLRAVADEFPEVDLWAARRRAEPFEKAFGRKLELDWQAPANQAAAG